MVETEFAEVMTGNKETGAAIYRSVGQGACLQAEDMAKAIKYMIEAPKHVQVHDILVRPTKQ